MSNKEPGMSEIFAEELGNLRVINEQVVEALDRLKASTEEQLHLVGKQRAAELEFSRVANILAKAEIEARALIFDKQTEYEGGLFPTNNAEARSAFIDMIVKEPKAVVQASKNELSDIAASLVKSGLASTFIKSGLDAYIEVSKLTTSMKVAMIAHFGE